MFPLTKIMISGIVSQLHIRCEYDHHSAASYRYAFNAFIVVVFPLMPRILYSSGSVFNNQSLNELNCGDGYY